MSMVYFATISSTPDDVELTVYTADEVTEDLTVVLRSRMIPTVASLVISTLADCTPLLTRVVAYESSELTKRLARQGVPIEIGVL